MLSFEEERVMNHRPVTFLAGIGTMALAWPAAGAAKPITIPPRTGTGATEAGNFGLVL